MAHTFAGAVLLAATMIHSVAFGMPPAEADPHGVLIKPIPERLVVLTFDDGCASGATVVAPILKQLGFGGSFYVCDFDSFRTRKDWYLTWRQMRALDADGFEIGNHTVGHAGGAGIGPFLAMEDELLAHHVPKPTTIAWPVYQVNTRTYPDLAANGYAFGRGGHFRPYRPTVDNPFDVPSMGGGDIETFVRNVRQATGGRIVVITFHGVPDMEHPAVGLEPATFKVMMQYLKDNDYKVIALRDLAKYIDPAKAAKLPPTTKDFKESGAVIPVKEDKPGNYAVTNDLKEEYPLNQLNFAGASVKVDGKSLAFVTNGATAAMPRINQSSRGGITISSAVKLDANLTVDAAAHGEVTLGGLVSGAGSLTKNGEGQLRITNVKNTYSGGTVVNKGSLFVLVANEGLGSGPITLGGDASLDLEHVDGNNPLILNGGTINAGNGFGDSWNGDITLNGDTKISSYADFLLNNKSGGISGPGGITHIGCRGGFGMVNRGTVTLCGANTYTGATIVRRGTLRILKAASLYNADEASWTPAKITVATAATLLIRVGGPGEFTGAQVGTLLKNLASNVDNNGLMAGAVLCLDTTNATGTVTVPVDLADSKGPGGGAFVLKKRGAGTLRLSGNNTYTGPTIMEGGALGVSSLNSVVKGRPGSSLGAPTSLDNGEIVIGGGDGECTLVYTGKGETSDRVIDLAGKKSTVTFDQSGAGLLKLTGTFVISGYGADKTIALKGDTAGAGEIAGNIVDPYDRAGKATTAVTKSGGGTWTLSGDNCHTGATTVTGGILCLANPRSLGPDTDVHVGKGAKLRLAFDGQAVARKLYLDGELQPDGSYGAANCPDSIEGKGTLRVQSGGHAACGQSRWISGARNVK